MDSKQPPDTQSNLKNQNLGKRGEENVNIFSIPKVHSIWTLNHRRAEIVHYFDQHTSMIGVCAVVLGLIQVSYSQIWPLLEAKSMPELSRKTKQVSFDDQPQKHLEVSFMIGFGPAQSSFAVSQESENFETPSPFSGEVTLIPEFAMESNSMKAYPSFQLQSKRISLGEEEVRLPKIGYLRQGVNAQERRQHQVKEQSLKRGVDLSKLRDIVDKLRQDQLENRIQTLSHLKRIRRILENKKRQLMDQFMAPQTPSSREAREKEPIESIESRFYNSFLDQTIVRPNEQRETIPNISEDIGEKTGPHLATEINKLQNFKIPETDKQDIEMKFEDKKNSLLDSPGEETQQISI